jgi:hypothetical protein
MTKWETHTDIVICECNNDLTMSIRTEWEHPDTPKNKDRWVFYVEIISSHPILMCCRTRMNEGRIRMLAHCQMMADMDERIIEVDYQVNGEGWMNED